MMWRWTRGTMGNWGWKNAKAQRWARQAEQKSSVKMSSKPSRSCGLRVVPATSRSGCASCERLHHAGRDGRRARRRMATSGRMAPSSRWHAERAEGRDSSGNHMREVATAMTIAAVLKTIGQSLKKHANRRFLRSIEGTPPGTGRKKSAARRKSRRRRFDNHAETGMICHFES